MAVVEYLSWILSLELSEEKQGSAEVGCARLHPVVDQCIPCSLSLPSLYPQDPNPSSEKYLEINYMKYFFFKDDYKIITQFFPIILKMLFLLQHIGKVYIKITL